MKRAFTLIELLAVIVILSIILVIAMPKLLEVIEKMHLKSIESSSNIILKGAENESLIEHAIDSKKDVKAMLCKDIIDLKDNYAYCYVKYDGNRKGTISLKGAPNSKYENLECTGTLNNVTCTKRESKKCTYDGTLTKGAEFVDGQYTYRYKQNATAFDNVWTDFNGDGWGVRITDLASTDPVTTELCSTINNKPIIKTNDMFRGSNATSIDISSLNSYYVTDMSQMFWRSKATEIIGLNKLSTINVTAMESMFNSSPATEIDVSSFDTSKVTTMKSMFGSTSAVQSIDVSTFDTSNVTTMESMFNGCKATEIKGLNSFNTSKVRNMKQMFQTTSFNSIDVSSFDTSIVTNMNSMFNGSKSILELDVSNFDTSSVTDMNRIFYNMTVRKIYANNFTSTSNPTISEIVSANNYYNYLNIENFDFTNLTVSGNLMGHDHARTIILKDCEYKALFTTNVTRATFYDKNGNLCS